MTTVFVSQDIWPLLTKAAKSSKQQCDVAVAYFGAGASRLLPLPEGSRLVVDANERTVGSGQTCPADLLKMVKRGVVIFSVPNLHAKVFVLGRAAYVGSTNVSNRSATHLVEAVIRTTEPSAVRDARSFVNRHCLHEQTPELLKQLAQVYRAPMYPGDKRRQGKAKETSSQPTLPQLFLAQLRLVAWSDSDQVVHDRWLAAVKKLREHARSFELDSFRQAGQCPYTRGDVVIQVTKEDNGSVLVDAPGNVLHVRRRLADGKRVSFVYLERPSRRRRQVKTVAQHLGCPEKRLRKGGLVRDQSFAKSLLSTLAITS